jgi:predicted dehydrogenase
MANSKKLKYAMIGGGEKSFIGPIHRMAVRLDDSAELVDGCYSHNDDWHELLERVKGKVDFLTICTPNDSHFEIAKAALEAKMHVFCEKPVSMNAQLAMELKRLAKRYRRIVAVPFTYLGSSMIKLAHDLVKNGELGKICKINIEYVQGSFRKVDPNEVTDLRIVWKKDPKRSGPSCVTADIGVHAASLIEYISGLKIKSVLADVSTFSSGTTLEDDASILMRLSKGAKASLVVSKVATGEENGVRVRVYGEKASLHWDQENPNYLSVKYPFEPERIYKRNAPYIRDKSMLSKRLSRIPAGHPEGFIEAFANIYREFCRAISGEKDCDFPTIETGVMTMKFVDAVLMSARKNSIWINL